MSSKNKNMNAAKINKNDEFYTQFSDINNEVMKYKDQFKDKIIYLNCDDPEESNFFKFFAMNFNFFKLKKLISTHYHDTEPTYKLELTRDNVEEYVNFINVDRTFKPENIDKIKTPLLGNGDFRNAECVESLKEADIIVTNPPFSLFREYVAQLIEYDKKFLIIGNQNALTYKEIFPLIKDDKIWLGYNSNKSFIFKSPYTNESESNRRTVKSKGYDPDDGYIVVPAITWFTNLDTTKKHELLPLWKKYNQNDFPKYDNYDAINVSRTSDIPFDYTGIMGVPITIINVYNPDQFKILGSGRWSKDKELEKIYTGDRDSVYDDLKTTINGKETYNRIFIKHKMKYTETGLPVREGEEDKYNENGVKTILFFV